jgi:YVTN family beta-propeller protein
MRLRICSLALAAFALAVALGSAQSLAQNAYITNSGDNTVSVIDTKTNTVIGSPIPVGELPWGVAVSPNGSRVYIANGNSGTVSVIDARTNTAISTIAAGTNYLRTRGIPGRQQALCRQRHLSPALPHKGDRRNDRRDNRNDHNHGQR